MTRPRLVPEPRFWGDWRVAAQAVQLLLDWDRANFMHCLTLGDFELIGVSDGTYPLDGGGLFGVVPKSLWERKVKADEHNLVTAGLNSLVVRTGKNTVLVETGIGSKLPEKMVKIFGQPG